MPQANIGYLYYEEYYRYFEDGDWRALVEEDKPKLSSKALQGIQGINSKIKGATITDTTSDCCIRTNNWKSFDLITTYPGLLTGAGYSHSAGSIEGEFKLGFYFDHTTGMPVITGSSAKGTLRSAFPGKNKDNRESRQKYIEEILQSLGIENIDVCKLEQEIFEGIIDMNAGGSDGQLQETNIPLCKRDIFLDAYIVGSANSGGRFLDEDFITPHKHKSNPNLDEYANPTPIKFLKVLPGVAFRFQFDLKDGSIAADQKCRLFKKIILDLGIGAKTSVGYGQFAASPRDTREEIKKEKDEERRRDEEKQKRLAAMPPADKLFEEHNHDINSIINALRNDEVNIDNSDKIEAATRIKSIMIEKKIWQRPKKPKDKIRVSFIKSILNQGT